MMAGASLRASRLLIGRPPPAIVAATAVCAAGSGRQALASALFEGRSGLQHKVFEHTDTLHTCIGEVAGLEHHALTGALRAWDCRCARLIALAFAQDHLQSRTEKLITQFGAQRVGVFWGTTTSGILETELSFRRDRFASLPPGQFDHCHAPQASLDVVRLISGARGVGQVISTACSSSAKVFAAATRAMATGLCDAAIVGGADSLALSTLYGFHSLQLLSDEPCRPFDAHRNGISIGEAAAVALLEPGGREEQSLQLLGYGESSDAYHMSSPHPEALGSIGAMQQAMVRAGLQPHEIDYINLHGTGTMLNDQSESIALARLFPPGVACSSTKGITGHCLGAAGALEAVIASLAIENALAPANHGLRAPDDSLPYPVSAGNVARPMHRVMSNSFGFGGTNCSLIFGDAA